MTSHEILGILVGFVTAGVLSFIGYQIWWHMKYRKEYSELKTDKGLVTDMDYTPPRSRYNAATKTTSTTPELHEVFIKFDQLGDHDFDDEELYQAVRLDDEVQAEYVEVYRVEKENPQNKEFMHFTFKTIISPKGRRVNLE